MPLPVFKRPLQYCPQAPRGAPPPKNLHPHFRQILRGRGPNFCFHYMRTPKARQGKILITVPWPTYLNKEFRNFAENRLFLELREMAVCQKCSQCARSPSLLLGQSSAPYGEK